MRIDRGVDSCNPVGDNDIATWGRDRQDAVWARVQEQTQGDGALILGELGSASPQRGFRVAVAVAVLVPVLIAGLLLARLSDSGGDSDLADGTQVAVAPLPGQVPVTMELSTSGGIWAADASLDREQAVRAFVKEAFGWREGVEISIEGDLGSPSWITMTKSGVSVTALFVPTDTTPGTWTIIQIGQVQIGLQMLYTDGSADSLEISRFPSETASVVIHLSDGTGTVSTVIEEVSSSIIRVPLTDTPRATLVIFVDASGKVIDAIGGESGPYDEAGITATSAVAAAPAEVAALESIIQLGDRFGEQMIEFGLLDAPEGTEQVALDVNGKHRAIVSHVAGIASGLSTAEFTTGVVVAVVALSADGRELGRSVDEYLPLTESIEGAPFAPDPTDVEAVLSESRDAAGAHLPGWRALLGSERVWCMYKDGSGV